MADVSPDAGDGDDVTGSASTSTSTPDKAATSIPAPPQLAPEQEPHSPGSAGGLRDVSGASTEQEDESDDADEDEEEDNEDEEEEDDDEEEEPKLKYARLTQHLTTLYRNGDATSTFLVAGDKMVCSNIWLY